ncbi:hypothetical protein HDU83_004237 [Entophlyctis luteolus]|nr:hypothetical protein HDU83_004237 [Entophlyctis luteolus]
MSMRIKAVLVNEIYCKSLKRIPGQTAPDDDTNDDDDASVGKIVTLMSTDAETIRDSLPEMYDLIVLPFQVIAAVVGLLKVIGWPALAGLAVMILSLPATYVNSLWNIRVYEKLLAAQDARTTVVNEVLQGIRIIKYFAWEKKFLEKIDLARQKELRTLIESYLINATNTFIWLMTPLIVSFVTLVTLTKIAGENLDAQMAFTCLSLFNNLRFPLMVIPFIISDVFRLKVAFDRLEKYLKQEELEGQASSGLSAASSVIGFKNGVFQWYSAATRKSTVVVEENSSSERTPLVSKQFSSTSMNTVIGDDSKTVGFTLKDLNFEMPIGKLTVVCGATGAGKSSLLQALLGEMKRISGNSFLPRGGSNLSTDDGFSSNVAYVAQTSWLQNATIRDNITFGLAYDPDRYDKVVKACALGKDLATFEAGDLTEIGEKGINLSGGQKQRISLARALYSHATIVLLDDPLSAVDAPTAKHLYEKAICGPLMKNRTRILVTHATSLVLKNGAQTHFVVAIQSGSVIAAGSLPEILDVPGVSSILGISEPTMILKTQGSSSSLSSTFTAVSEHSKDDSEDEDDNQEAKDYANGASVDNAAKLIDVEGSATGAIKGVHYFNYLKNAGGVSFVLLMLVFNIGDRFINIFNDYWIKVWSDAYGNGTMANLAAATVFYSSSTKFMDGITVANLFPLSSTKLISADKPAVDVDYFIYVYALISGTWVVVFLTAVAIRSWGSYKASKQFHEVLISRIVFSPMRFFDTTPIGRILNRATKDISVIDDRVMRSFEELMGGVIDALAVVIVISREIKRLESTTKSPIYSMFSETLVGVSTIRAYGAESRFIAENLNRVDTNHRAFFYMWGANRWFGVRVSTISGLVILIAALGTVTMRNVIGAGLAGLSLTWALSFSDHLVWIVRVHAGLEMNMNAVERVSEYSNVEQEKPAIIESNRPPLEWPTTGALVVSNLELRYSPDQAPVLKDVSFAVKGGEKVGIVGRTGAGKSSLSLSLFRIIEPSAGTITIDGIDISTIGLFDLRSKLTMIPQDPVLFAGTIRSNLDPFNEYEDAEIWFCLKQVRFLESMKTAKEEAKMQEGKSESAVADGISLEYLVTDGGSNFSQGQRQLLCLARALLKSSSLTVFDEGNHFPVVPTNVFSATASVDYETDARIQEVIRGPAFRNTTVLSIAHRLRTIADYDKILVLEKGCVVQFGSPLELMQVEGVFKTMCEDSGEKDILMDLARQGIH